MDDQKRRFVSTSEEFKDDDAKDELQRSVDQAIGNTEVLWPIVKELQEKVASLESRISDLEEDAARRGD